MLLTTAQLTSKKRSESLSNKLRVKVTKTRPDNLRHLCGEEVQVDEKGNEYFIIPASCGEYVGKVFTAYTLGEEFLPEEEILKLKEKKTVPTIDETFPPDDENPKYDKEEHFSENIGKRKPGNPNWGKKATLAPEGV